MPKLTFKGERVGNQWDDELDLSSFNDRLVGIEVEVENAPGLLLGDPEATLRAALTDAPYWAAIKDGSLRNGGAEFVSFPLPISKLEEAVWQLFAFQTKYKQNWKGSVRTGIHVHVNVRDFCQAQLQNLLVGYTLVEPALFHYVGKEREEGIYCVPWYRAPGDAKHAASCLEDGLTQSFYTRLHQLSGSLAKYTSLFLAPITRIGTVEFRMAPTWLNAPKIIEWTRICERIIANASKCSTYYNVLENYDNNPSGFVHNMTDGLLDPPDHYADIVNKCGADLLARTLFPEVLPEWVRLMDKFIPIKTSKYYGQELHSFTKPHYKIGDTKINKDTGIRYIWDGAKWLEDKFTIPHGHLNYLGGGKWQKWNATMMQYVKIYTEEAAAHAPPPKPLKPKTMNSLYQTLYSQSNSTTSTIPKVKPTPPPKLEVQPSEQAMAQALPNNWPSWDTPPDFDNLEPEEH